MILQKVSEFTFISLAWIFYYLMENSKIIKNHILNLLNQTSTVGITTYHEIYIGLESLLQL